MKQQIGPEPARALLYRRGAARRPVLCQKHAESFVCPHTPERAGRKGPYPSEVREAKDKWQARTGTARLPSLKTLAAVARLT